MRTYYSVEAYDRFDGLLGVVATYPYPEKGKEVAVAAALLAAEADETHGAAYYAVYERCGIAARLVYVADVIPALVCPSGD